MTVTSPEEQTQELELFYLCPVNIKPLGLLGLYLRLQFLICSLSVKSSKDCDYALGLCIPGASGTTINVLIIKVLRNAIFRISSNH